MLKQKLSATAVLEKLKSLANPKAAAGMARFGIPTHNTLGISVPALRKLARELGKSHELAEKLWQSGVHEAQILAPMVDVPERVTGQQMERWVKQIDSWAVCDGCCLNLFVKTPFAHRKAMEWSRRKEEFVKRAGFALMAALAVHDKQVGHAKFMRFLPVIKRESVDERNFVKKAVNWALRQIGKRNLQLNKAAIRTGHGIQKMGSRSARWIAADALRELNSEAVAMRLRRTIVRRPRS